MAAACPWWHDNLSEHVPENATGTGTNLFNPFTSFRTAFVVHLTQNWRYFNHCACIFTGGPLCLYIHWRTIVLGYWLEDHCAWILTGGPLWLDIHWRTIVIGYSPGDHCAIVRYSLLSAHSLFNTYSLFSLYIAFLLDLHLHEAVKLTPFGGKRQNIDIKFNTKPRQNIKWDNVYGRNRIKTFPISYTFKFCHSSSSRKLRSGYR